MAKKKTPWITPLGLTKNDFKARPKGFDPLIWGLKNKAVDQDDYLAWATEYYQLPAIKEEFFSMAVDFTLLEKKKHIHAWSASCYPVYTWNDTLFIACLEPVEINTQEKLCFVIAPFFPMEKAWDKFQNTKATKSTQPAPPVQQESPTIPVANEKIIESDEVIELPPVNAQPSPSHEPASKSEQKEAPHREDDREIPDLNLDGLEQRPSAQGAQKTEAQSTDKNANESSMDSLDFSSMGTDENEGPLGKTEEASNEEAEDKNPNAAEITQTKIDDQGLNQFTTATETLHLHRENLSDTNEEEQLPELNFESLSTNEGSLKGSDSHINQSNPSARTQEPIIPPPPQRENHTHKIDSTASPKVPPPPPGDINIIPDLSDLVANQTEGPQRAPGMEVTETELKIPQPHDEDKDQIEQESPAPPSPLSLNSENEEFDDDYTPIPEISASPQRPAVQGVEAKNPEKNQPPLELSEITKSNLGENTITYTNQPLHTPPENLIEAKDLERSDELEDCNDMKEIVAHFFGHLKRDYNNLLFVQKEEGNMYFPKYVFGHWKMTSLAWRMHINLNNPNIFRIAHLSGHPFHGEVSNNPYNDKYFEWWTQGKKPDFVTIYPISIDDDIIGFITGFDKGPEFDDVGSLKKIENLISICKKKFLSSKGLKAA